VGAGGAVRHADRYTALWFIANLNPSCEGRRSRWHGQAEGPSSPTSAPTRGRFRRGPGSRWQTAGRSYAPDPAAVGTMVSQAVDSQPRGPVRAPTTIDTHATTTTSTADARWGGASGRSTKLRRALHPRAHRHPHKQAKNEPASCGSRPAPSVGGTDCPMCLTPTRGGHS
jgi:hypothetical protein